MFQWLLLCFAAVCLAATTVHAATGHDGGMLTKPDTDIAGIYTPQRVISAHPHHVLLGHVIVVERAGMQAMALVIHQRRDGVHRLRFDAAWHAGTALAFTSTASGGLGCTHGHCRDNQVGLIVLSPEAFEHARHEGFSARLIGASGAIDITAAAALFEEAAHRAAALGRGTAE